MESCIGEAFWLVVLAMSPLPGFTSPALRFALFALSSLALMALILHAGIAVFHSHG